jgi:hypothetical protein
VGLSSTNWPVGEGVGVGDAGVVGLGVGGVDPGVGVVGGVDTGDGVALGVVVLVAVRVCDGATEAVAVDVEGTDVAVGADVDVDVDGVVGVALGGAVGVRERVGDGLGTVVGVAEGVDVGVRVGSSPLSSVGAPVEAGVSVRALPGPTTGVNRSKAWTVAMRLSIALFLCMARTINKANTTARTTVTKPKPTIGRLRLSILIFAFSHVQAETTEGRGGVDICLTPERHHHILGWSLKRQRLSANLA